MLDSIVNEAMVNSASIKVLDWVVTKITQDNHSSKSEDLFKGETGHFQSGIKRSVQF